MKIKKERRKERKKKSGEGREKEREKDRMEKRERRRTEGRKRERREYALIILRASHHCFHNKVNLNKDRIQGISLTFQNTSNTLIIH